MVRNKKKDRKSKRQKRRESQGKEVFYYSATVSSGREKRSRAYSKVKRSKPVESSQVDGQKPQKVKKKDRGSKRRERKKEKVLDYNKTFYMPDGKGFQVAYRDLQCETTLEELLSRFSSKSTKTLYNRIIELLNMEETYDRDLQKETNGMMGGSSGKAGKCAFSSGNVLSVQSDVDYLRNKNNVSRSKSKQKKREGKKPLWYHQGQYDYWQNITQNGSFFITHFTPRQLLVISCGIMSYVVEMERRYFYQALYHDICGYIPELKDYLPRP